MCQSFTVEPQYAGYSLNLSLKTKYSLLNVLSSVIDEELRTEIQPLRFLQDRVCVWFD